MLDELVFLAQVPPLDSGYGWLMFVSRVLHILGAIIMVGGLFYLWAVITPLRLREGPGEGSSAASDHYFGGPRATWAKWVGIASALLLVTGLWNFIQNVTTYKIVPVYHMLGTLKIVAGLALMLLAALLAGRTAAAESIRRKWRLWLSVCLILGIITVVVGSVMRTYPRTPKLDAATPPQLIAPANTSWLLASAATDHGQRTKYNFRWTKNPKNASSYCNKKVNDLQQRLAGARKQMDDPDEVRQLESDLAAAQQEIEKLKRA